MFIYNISHATLGPDLSLGEEEGSGYVPTFKLSPRTAIMHGKLAISLDTMHTIANDLLIAPLNFATQLGVLKHSPMSCHI